MVCIYSLSCDYEINIIRVQNLFFFLEIIYRMISKMDINLTKLNYDLNNFILFF